MKENLYRENLNQENNMPHNSEIEQMVLSAILNNNSCYDKISDILKSEDFFEKIHQKIYKSITTRLESGQLADILTLINFFSIEEEINYLASLSENVYPSENIRNYAELLILLSKKRQLLTISLTLQDMKTNSVEDQINYAENAIYSIQSKTMTNHTIKFFEGAKKVLHKAEELITQNKQTSGIPTGFLSLNNLLGGFRSGELIILAGRPSVGKTAFATDLAINIAQSKEAKILIFSLEMSYEQICMRIISSLTEVSMSKLFFGKLSINSLKYCANALNKFRELPIFIHDSSFININQIRSFLRQMRRQEQINLVIIDYLQLIESVNREDSREREISLVSRNLKLIAKELDLPIIALSQMSRDIEKRKDSNTPKMSDLRGSGAIEQDADVIGILYRPNEKIRENINLAIVKNRNGPVGEVLFKYNSECTSFKEDINNFTETSS